MVRKGVGKVQGRRSEEPTRPLRQALRDILQRAVGRLLDEIMEEVARSESAKEEALRSQLVAAIESLGARSSGAAARSKSPPRAARRAGAAEPSSERPDGKVTAMEFLMRHLAERGPAKGGDIDRAGEAAGLGRASLVKARTRARAAGRIALVGDAWTLSAPSGSEPDSRP